MQTHNSWLCGKTLVHQPKGIWCYSPFHVGFMGTEHRNRTIWRALYSWSGPQPSSGSAVFSPLFAKILPFCNVDPFILTFHIIGVFPPFWERESTDMLDLTSVRSALLYSNHHPCVECLGGGGRLQMVWPRCVCLRLGKWLILKEMSLQNTPIMKRSCSWIIPIFYGYLNLTHFTTGGLKSSHVLHFSAHLSRYSWVQVAEGQPLTPGVTRLNFTRRRAHKVKDPFFTFKWVEWP